MQKSFANFAYTPLIEIIYTYFRESILFNN